MSAAKDMIASLPETAAFKADFALWYDLLTHWNKRINLVGKSTLDDFWTRHALDSAQVYDEAPETAKIFVDLGSGAGFPGVAIAIMSKSREGALVHLVESNNKKASFLREVVRKLDLPARVHAERAESLEPSSVDIVTARAFAPLPRLLAYSEPFWGPNTIGLFLKGRQVQSELDEASDDWQFSSSIKPSRADPDGCLLTITGLSLKP